MAALACPGPQRARNCHSGLHQSHSKLSLELASEPQVLKIVARAMSEPPGRSKLPLKLALEPQWRSKWLLAPASEPKRRSERLVVPASEPQGHNGDRKYSFKVLSLLAGSLHHFALCFVHGYAQAHIGK